MDCQISASKQGVKAIFDSKIYLFDNRHTKEEAINLVSHGHHDHLPTKYDCKKIICSKETQAMIKLRRKKDVKRMALRAIQR